MGFCLNHAWLSQEFSILFYFILFQSSLGSEGGRTSFTVLLSTACDTHWGWWRCLALILPFAQMHMGSGLPTAAVPDVPDGALLRKL